MDCVGISLLWDDSEPFIVGHILFDTYNWKEEDMDDGLSYQEIVDKRLGKDFWTEKEAYAIGTVLLDCVSELTDINFNNVSLGDNNLLGLRFDLHYAWVFGYDTNGEFHDYYEIEIIGDVSHTGQKNEVIPYIFLVFDGMTLCCYFIISTDFNKEEKKTQ